MNRITNMSDSDFLWFLRRLHNHLQADLSILQNYGLTLEKLNDFNAKIKLLSDFPENLYYSGMIKVNVGERKEIKSDLIYNANIMDIRVAGKFGRDSIQYRNLGFSAPSRLSDGELITTLRNGAAYLTELLPEMSDTGLTAEGIEEFVSMIDTFDNSVTSKKNLENLKREKTKERIALINELYEIAGIYCSYGKIAFKRSNPVNYSFYLRPARTSPELKVQMKLNYNSEAKMINWESVENATSYQLQKYNGRKFIEVYAGEQLSFKFVAAGGSNIFRIRPRNSKGFGIFSEELVII